MKAAKQYDAEKAKFLTYYDFFLKRQFAHATGWDTNRKSAVPTLNTISLYTPIGEDDDSLLIDIISDNSADFSEIVYYQNMHEAIQEALDTLPADQKAAIIARYFDGVMNVDQKTCALAMRNLRKPEVSEKLSRFL